MLRCDIHAPCSRCGPVCRKWRERSSDASRPPQGIGTVRQKPTLSLEYGPALVAARLRCKQDRNRGERDCECCDEDDHASRRPRRIGSRIVESPYVIVYAVVDDTFWRDFLLGDALEASSTARTLSGSSRERAAIPRSRPTEDRRAGDAQAALASTSGECARDWLV